MTLALFLREVCRCDIYSPETNEPLGINALYSTDKHNYVNDCLVLITTESTRVDPIGQYGRSKLEADRIALQFAECGLPINILRPRTVLDKRRAGIYQILFDWIENDKRIYMLGDGTNDFQLVSHVT